MITYQTIVLAYCASQVIKVPVDDPKTNLPWNSVWNTSSWTQLSEFTAACVCNVVISPRYTCMVKDCTLTALLGLRGNQRVYERANTFVQ